MFGYYIEVAKAQIDLVPADWTRKQTTVNAERYISQELKELEHTILSAQDKVVALEYQLFSQMREQVCAQVAAIQRSAAAAGPGGRAQLSGHGGRGQQLLYAPGGRAPTSSRSPRAATPWWKRCSRGGLFVPNDTHMDGEDDLCAILTGPNMAGKSTYMRQVALIVLMAQMGSFVPASSAHIGVVDRIFTRIGASDDLSSGKSTFMVEMTEVAALLKNATRRLPAHSGRDRPGHQHLRRHGHRPGGAGVLRGQEAPGLPRPCSPPTTTSSPLWRGRSPG